MACIEVSVKHLSKEQLAKSLSMSRSMRSVGFGPRSEAVEISIRYVKSSKNCGYVFPIRAQFAQAQKRMPVIHNFPEKIAKIAFFSFRYV